MRCLGYAALLALAPALYGRAQANELAANLKLRVHLENGVIKVADLWENAGKNADLAVGPAPPPGHSINVEAVQLAYIARIYDVNWHPISGAERTIVERPGRPLTRDELADSLRQSLIDAGASPTARIEFGSVSPVLVSPSLSPLLTVEQMAYEPALERFSASIAVAGEGVDTQRMRVSGLLIQAAPAVVAARRLSAGDVITVDDVRVEYLPLRQLPGPVASEVAQVLGQSPKHAVAGGQPLALTDVGPQVIVPKGATIVMVVESPGLALSAQGIALAAGGRDDLIQVMNPLSRAVLQARITGPGRAIIEPDSSPLVLPRSVPRNPEVAE